MNRRVVVVGAGAAGTMAAIFAASRGARTILLERTADGGRKILISGGGRCNILPSIADESRFVSEASAHRVRRFVRAWPLREQVQFFERELGLALFEEPESRKLFPSSQSGRDARDRLLSHARRLGVEVVTGALVTSLVRIGVQWHVAATIGRYEADAVVMATGGLSVPKTGSDGIGLQIAASLGVPLIDTYPALTPLVSSTSDVLRPLAGISLLAEVTSTSPPHHARARGGLLLTHTGYSGPAILDVAHVVTRGLDLTHLPVRTTVRWGALSEDDWRQALSGRGAASALSAVARHLPHRLASAIVATAGVAADRGVSQLPRAERERLVRFLTHWPLEVTGHEGFRKAEVTGGGVSLDAVDPATLECRAHRGLHVCGEMLDAFGPIGGYNFQWAWATGRTAGIAAARAS